MGTTTNKTSPPPCRCLGRCSYGPRQSSNAMLSSFSFFFSSSHRRSVPFVSDAFARRPRPGWGNGCCWVARLGLVPPGCRCLTFLSAVVPLLCLGARPLPTLPPTGPAVCQCRTFRFAHWLDPGSLLPPCCFPFSRIRFAVPNPLTSNLVSCRGVGHGSQGSAELFEI